MPEFSDSTIHHLRNQLHTLDENILRLYLVEREFNSFARPILHWFVNRPEIISVLDATDILTSSFIKKYGGTPGFWRAYVSVANEEMRAKSPESTELPGLDTKPATTASPVATPVAVMSTAPTLHADNTTGGNASAENDMPAQNEQASTHAESDTAEISQQRPTSPLQTAGTPPQRVRAKTAPRPNLPQAKPSGSLVAVSALADQDAELIETPAQPAVDLAPKSPEPAGTGAALPAESNSGTTSEAATDKNEASEPNSDEADSKPKENKPLPPFVQEPERELLFEHIRVTLGKLMKERDINNFKVLAETVAKTANDYEGITAPVSILYALHSGKIFRKHNRTYVTSRQSALKILRLLRHMLDEKGNHLASTDEELMNEFKTKRNRPPTTRKAASSVASN